MNEQFTFWLNLITSMTAIIGLFLVAYELYRARKAEVRQFQFDTYRMFSIDLKQDRLIETRLRGESKENLVARFSRGDDAFHAMKNLLDFYTLLASAARDRTINREAALKYWGQPVLSFWSSYGSLLVESREMFGKEAASDLEWFNNEAAKVHRYYAEKVLPILQTQRAERIKERS